MTRILEQAWNVYKKNFRVIAAVILAIWLPLNLLSSYMDYFVFGPEEVRKSFKFMQFLDNFIGIIATAGIIFIGHTSLIGEQCTFKTAMRMGVQSWGRMWWTRLLTGLSLLLGFILLIIPGIYLMVRLALVEPVAVCERVSGSAAMRRSFDLTKGHFWQLFLLGLLFGGILVILMICLTIPAIFIPAFDHWLVDAATSVLTDFIVAFSTLCILSAYEIYSTPSPEEPLA